MCVWLSARFRVLVSKRPAEPGHERLLKRAGAERLQLVGVEGAEPREQLVGVAEAMIDADAELVDVPRRLLHRRQILELTRRTSARGTCCRNAAAIGSIRSAGI